MQRSSAIFCRCGIAVLLFSLVIGVYVVFSSQIDDDDKAEKRQSIGWRFDGAQQLFLRLIDENNAEFEQGPGCNPRRAEDPCKEAASCDTGGKFNYLEWYYCGEARWLKLVVYLVVLIFYFFILATVAEDFFCPTLALLSQMLQLSPDVAGMTIMAFGNGMPDLFSSFAAVQQGQLPIALGALVGAGSFISLIVVAAVAVVSKVKVKKFPFCRDVAAYLLGILLLALCILSGYFKLWMSIFFVSYYIVYVSISIFINFFKNQRMKQRKAKQECQLDILAAEEKAELDQFYTFCSKDGLRIHVFGANQDHSDPDEQSVHDLQLHSASSSTASLTRGVPTHPRHHHHHHSLHSMHAAVSSSSSDSDKDEAAEEQPLVVSGRRGETRQTRRGETFQVDVFRGENTDSDVPYHPQPSAEDVVVMLSPRAARAGALLLASSQPDGRSKHRPLNQTSNDIISDEHVDQIHQEYKNVAADNIAFLTSHALDAHLISPPPPSIAKPLTTEEIEAAASEERNYELVRRYCCKVACNRSLFVVPWRRLPSLFRRRIEWDEKTLFEKIVWVITSPLLLALNLTIPRVEAESWHKLMAVLNPLFAPLLICLATESFDSTVGNSFPIPVLLLCFGMPLSALIFFTTTSKVPRRMHLYLLAAFILSIFWVYIVADELVSLLQSFGYIFKISPTILGLTVLAWGNSTGDLISNVVIARQGFPQMALAATYGGPLFNLMIGLGVSLIVVCIAIFPRSYPTVMSPELGAGFLFLALGLATTILTVPFSGFVLTRKFAFYLIGIFVVQTILAVATTL